MIYTSDSMKIVFFIMYKNNIVFVVWNDKHYQKLPTVISYRILRYVKYIFSLIKTLSERTDGGIYIQLTNEKKNMECIKPYHKMSLSDKDIVSTICVYIIMNAGGGGGGGDCIQICNSREAYSF